MRDFRRFFLSLSAPDAAGLEVFFAALDSVVLAGALEAVEAGALPAVEAGLGAIANDERGWVEWAAAKGGGGTRERYGWSWSPSKLVFIQARVPKWFVWPTRRHVTHR